MSINKDEALRAKEKAENLMKKSDFTSARRLALRAQKLDSGLENISQMIMVCDVHCAAAEKKIGNKTDWYSILQVNHMADDAAIKKQYKKLALLLHPDKNKLPGAEAAFKLIGEAQRLLSGKDKRSAPVPPSHRPPQPPTYYTRPGVQTNSGVRPNSTGRRPGNQHQQQNTQTRPAEFTARRTFWTSCPYCHMKYEYVRAHINKQVSCETCKRHFTTFETHSQGETHPYQKASNTGQTHPQSYTTYSFGQESFSMPGCTARSGFSQPQKFPFNVEQKGPYSTSSDYSENISENRKRKKMVGSSESSDSEGSDSEIPDSVSSSSESEQDIDIDNNGGQGSSSIAGQQRRRSMRSKRQVSYNENLSDDDNFVNQDHEGPTENDTEERAKRSEIKSELHDDGLSKEAVSNRVNLEMKEEEKGVESPDSKTDSESENADEPKVFEYPDPDFNEFDELREKEKFQVGQTWAVYDTHDGMPRFYAHIMKVFIGDFKLKIRWLEPDPDDENELSWVDAGLPVSVGNFRFGRNETVGDCPIFSHVIHCEGRGKKGSFRVSPRKGETWALFKNWDLNWSSDPDSHQDYEYEFVEILSDCEGAAVSVAFLYKVKGFSCVFCRMGKDESGVFLIQPREFYRFSHCVPSFRLVGMEGKGVPEGSYELDPASLPQQIEEVSVPIPPNEPAA